MKFTFSLCLCIGILKGIWCDTSTNSVITIPAVGQVRGAQKTTISGKIFQAYRGIPFGKAPTGELRFRDPVPADPWVGEVLDVTQEGPTCVQYHALLRIPMGTEDCLKLNVYTPGVDNTNRSLPVMVWIHGGSWFMGSGNGEIDIYGPRRFLDRDIVLVTINYRLGPLGFLSTEDSEAPGNYGLLDQLLALKWVKENIRYFGGNQDLVTIFGQSAGGASVNHHIVSPLSKGLFHRAITQSGSSLNAWALERDKSVGSYSKLLAEDLGCPTSVSSELMACLRTKPVRDMVLFRKKIEVLGVIPIAFGPRIDIERESPFIPAHPKTLMEQKKINSVPTITGLTANEGALFVAVLLSRNGVLMKNFSENPINLLRYVVSEESALKSDDIVIKAASRYLSLDKPFDDQITQIEQLVSDYIFFQGIDEAAQLLSRVNDQSTYYYYYNHRGQMSFPTILGVPSDKNLGVSHTDEIYLMFSNELFSSTPTTPNDDKVSNILLDMWTSFAKDGVPRSDLVPGGWSPLTETQKRYLRIEAEDPTTVQGRMPFNERIKFLI